MVRTARKNLARKNLAREYLAREYLAREGRTARAVDQENRLADFGSWVRERMASRGVKLQQVAVETRLHYSYLSRLVNSGKSGKPIRPEQAKARQIGEALVRLGAAEDAADAEIAAGYIPEGWRIVPPGDATPPGDLTLITDLPPEWQEALAILLRVTPDKRPYTVDLWLEHVVSLLRLQEQKDALEGEVAELERRKAADEGSGARDASAGISPVILSPDAHRPQGGGTEGE